MQILVNYSISEAVLQNNVETFNVGKEIKTEQFTAVPGSCNGDPLRKEDRSTSLKKTLSVQSFLFDEKVAEKTY